jgi:hypothetical protein
MTPGLAFFYGGLVKAKSVISMMMLSFGAMGLIGVLWVLYGYAIAFPGSEGLIFPWSIDSSALGLSSLVEVPEGAAYPPLAFVAFQATFAIITVALVSGAIADRAKFGVVIRRHGHRIRCRRGDRCRRGRSGLAHCQGGKQHQGGREQQGEKTAPCSGERGPTRVIPIGHHVRDSTAYAA